MTTTSSVATQQPQQRGIDILKNTLNAESVKQQFTQVLKDNAPSFMASVIDLYNTDTSLQKCNPKEVVMEALKAAVLKLPINKSLGFAYLVPYQNSVKTADGWTKKMVPTFTMGYKGLIQLAMRTGQYRIINADVVYEGEAKVVSKLTGELTFDGAKQSDTIVGYFGHFELINGFTKTFYMSKEDVITHAKRFSKSFNSDKSPWNTDFDAMALKTCLRGLLGKWGYLSIEMVQAIDGDINNDHKEDHKREVLENANRDVVDFEDAEVEEVDEQTGEITQQPNEQTKQEAAPVPGNGAPKVDEPGF
jgi:recombination protein RecT